MARPLYGPDPQPSTGLAQLLYGHAGPCNLVTILLVPTRALDVPVVLVVVPVLAGFAAALASARADPAFEIVTGRPFPR